MVTPPPSYQRWYHSPAHPPTPPIPSILHQRHQRHQAHQPDQPHALANPIATNSHWLILPSPPPPSPATTTYPPHVPRPVPDPTGSCSGKETIHAENWYEGWRSSKACAPPMLLHPVKADTCGRFSTNGYGRGCWSRQVSGRQVSGPRASGTNLGTRSTTPPGHFMDELRNNSKSDIKRDAGYAVPMKPAQL